MALTNPISNAAGAGGELLSPEVSAVFLQGVATQSAILQVVPQTPVNTNALKVPIITAVDDPDFVDEGGVKPNGGADFDSNTINVAKVAQIVVITEENLADAVNDPTTYLDPIIRTKIASKIDAAALGFNKGAVYSPTKFDNKLSGTTQSVTVDKTDYAKSISEALALLEANGYNGDAAILSPTFKAGFRDARTTDKLPIFTPGFQGTPDNLYGVQLAYSANLQPLSGATKTVGFVVDTAALRLAVRTQVEVRVTREASVGGVSLFETNQVGLLYEQRIGFRALDLSRAVVKLVTAA